MINQTRLKELLHYDPETGVFTRLVDSPNGRHKAGGRQGAVAGRYRQIYVEGKPYLEHRIAWLYMTGSFPSGQIDHRNLDKCDNRWANLRDASISQNAANRASKAKSGLKGSYYIKNKKKCGSKPWKSSIVKDGKRYHLGNFTTREEAHAAYRAAAIQLHGEFARTV